MFSYNNDFNVTSRRGGRQRCIYYESHGIIIIGPNKTTLWIVKHLASLTDRLTDLLFISFFVDVSKVPKYMV